MADALGCCCCCEDSITKKSSKITATKGPRSCTDVPALVLFSIFCFGLVLIAAFASVQGNVWRLVRGVDSFGNVCGRPNTEREGFNNLSNLDLTSKPFLFSMDVLRPLESVWLCVESCPTTLISDRQQLLQYAELNGARLCSYEVPLEFYTDLHRFPSSSIGPCPVLPVYNSTSIFRRCIPNVASGLEGDVLAHVFSFLNSFDTFKQIFADLAASYTHILFLCGVAFFVSFLMVFIIRFVANSVIYLIFFCVVFAALGVTTVLWFVYFGLRLDLNELEILTNRTEILLTKVENEDAFLILSIISTTATVFLITIICWLRTRITLIVSLFREAGRFIRAMPCILMQPLITFAVLIIFFVGWSAVMLALASAGYKAKTTLTESDLTQAKFIAIQFNASHYLRCIWWYHFVGLIWVSEFILACQQMTIAGSVAIWFFTRDRQGLGWCTVGKSVRRLVVYQLGTVAFGAFVITLIKIPRILLLFILAKLNASPSRCAKGCAKCCVGCLYCIERCLRYVHHNAYTITAIEGRSFCIAAKQAFEILAANSLNIGVINSVGDFVLFLCKVTVTAIVIILGAFLLEANTEVHYFAVPLVLVALFAFFIAHCFFSVYEVVIDTLFLCYCEDLNMHQEQTKDAAATDCLHEYYSSKELMEFMECLQQANGCRQLRQNKAYVLSIAAASAKMSDPTEPAEAVSLTACSGGPTKL